MYTFHNMLLNRISCIFQIVHNKKDTIFNPFCALILSDNTPDLLIKYSFITSHSLVLNKLKVNEL